MPKPEGKTFSFTSEASIDSELLEVFPFNSPNQKISINTSEFTAVCPFSGLPDIASVNIEYYPTDNKCIELRSLKYYFITFRNVGIYQELVTKRIYDDLSAILCTTRLRVTTYYNTRGGLDTVCIEAGEGMGINSALIE